VTDSGRAVFLSYASQDAEAARRICDALRAAGIEVWFDQSELRGGDAWDASIRRQIKSCYLFVAIISANTQSREEGYFRREWKTAVDRTNDMTEGRAFLLPVVIDGTSDSEALVPEKFREVQWTRLPAGSDANTFVDQLRRLLAPNATTPVSTSAGSSVSPPAPRGAASTRVTAQASRSFVPWFVGILLIVATGYLLADKLLTAKHAVPAAEAPVAPPAHIDVVDDKSLAVLPFADMSEKRDQEYFADGMAEEVLDELVKVPHLKVISRAASFHYKGTSTDVRAIGAELGARYLVEGTVRRAGNKLRITAELINAEDGARRWSETYDRDIGDALKVQDEIASSLVRALEVEVTAGALEFPGRDTVQVPAAYDAFLRARHASDQFNKNGFDEALEDYHEALHLDPHFARAAAELALLQINMADWGYLPVETAFNDAGSSAELAIKLDPKLSMPHAVLALREVIHGWDWAAAHREVEKARTLQPRDAITENVAGRLAGAEGDWDEEIKRYKASLSLDPLWAGTHYLLCDAFIKKGRFDDAESAILKAMQISPSYAWAHYELGKVLLLRGSPANALAAFQAEPDTEARLAGVALAQYALGHRPLADAALDRLTQLARDDWASGIAGVHAYRGEFDESFRWLDRAFALKDVDIWAIKGDPIFANLWPDPRFRALLRKMNLPE
jgi:TolB-like protein/tetratricopeptide (TPR) repeat protein